MSNKIICTLDISNFLDKKKNEGWKEWDDFADSNEQIKLVISALAEHKDFSKLFTNADELCNDIIKILELNAEDSTLRDAILSEISIYATDEIEQEDESIHEGKTQGEEELPEFPTSISSWLGHSSILYGYLLTTTKDLFVKRIVADFSSPLITVPKKEVSTNLAKYKADLYRLLYDEIKSNKTLEAELTKLPNPGNKSLQKGWELIIELAKKHFFGNISKEDDINEKIESVTSKFLNNLSNSDAYLAFILLMDNNFDTMLRQVFNAKTLKINENLVNEYDDNTIQNKYSFMTESHYDTGWSDNEENKEALTSIPKAIEILLDTLPELVAPNTKDGTIGITENPNGRERLSVLKVIFLLNYVKSNASRFDLNGYLTHSRVNPMQRYRKLFEQLAKDGALPLIHRNVAYSIYHYFFDTQSLLITSEITKNGVKLKIQYLKHAKSLFNVKRKLNYTAYTEADLLKTFVSVFDRMREASYTIIDMNEDNELVLQRIDPYTGGVSYMQTVTDLTNRANNPSSSLLGTYKPTFASVLNNDTKNTIDTVFLLKLLVPRDGKREERSVWVTGDGFIDVLDKKKYNLSDVIPSKLTSDIINGIEPTDPKPKNLITILKCIDDVLHLGLLNGNIGVFNYFCGLEGLTDKTDTNITLGVNGLLTITSTVLGNQFILNDYQTNHSDLTLDSYMSPLLSHLSNDLSKDNKIAKNYYDSIEGTLKIIHSNSKLYENLGKAQSYVAKQFFKGTVKGINGNAVAKMKKTTLAQDLLVVINQIVKYAPYTGNMFYHNKLALGDACIFNGIKVNETSKLAKDMRPSEWNHVSFIFDYAQTLANSKKVWVQPVTYSDKTTFFKYCIDVSKPLKISFGGNYYEIDLTKATIDEIKLAIFLNRSQSYTSMYKKVFGGLKTILSSIIEGRTKTLLVEGKTFTPELLVRIDNLDLNNIDWDNIDNVRALMHLVSLELFNRAAHNNKIQASEELYYCKADGKLDVNLGLHYMATKIFNASSINSNHKDNALFNKWFNNNIKRAIQGMQKAGNQFSISDIPGSLSDALWFENNTLVFAKDKYGNKTTVLEGLEGLTYNPLITKFIGTDLLLSYDLRQALVGTELQHKDKGKFKKEGVKLYDYLYRNYSASDTDFDDVLLHINQLDLSSAKRTVNIGATIAQYQHGDLLGIPMNERRAVFEDLRAEVFGPNGFDGSIDTRDGGSSALLLESILRNKSLQSDAIKGHIGKSIEVSYTDSGAQEMAKYALHGMRNVDLRWSLGSTSNLMGLVRRMMSIRFFNEDTYHQYDKLDAAPTISIFDEDINKNLFNDDGTLKTEYLDIDLTKNLHGEKLNFDAIFKNLTYRDQYGTLYTINGLERTGKTKYLVKRTKLSSGGILISTDNIEVNINCLYDLWQVLGGAYSGSFVNGKFEYNDDSWEALANYVNNVGIYYGAVDENNNPTKTLTLFNTWQPLKNKYISIADMHSGIKNGAYCINSSESFAHTPSLRNETTTQYYNRLKDILKDDVNAIQLEGETNDAWILRMKSLFNTLPELDIESNEEYTARLESNLMYMTTSTMFAGELLDANHLVEDGDVDVTLPSQVLASLVQGGYTHDTVSQIYKAIALKTLVALKDLIPKIEEAITAELSSNVDDINFDLLREIAYETLGRIAIKAGDSDKFDVMAFSVKAVREAFLKLTSKHKDDIIKFPFSDSTLFAKVIADYASKINKTSIKGKTAGFAGVLSPAHSTILLYRIDDLNLTYDDLTDIANAWVSTLSDTDRKTELLQSTINERVRAYLSHKMMLLLVLPINNVTPGQVVKVCDASGNYLSDKIYHTENWKEYVELKDKYPDAYFKVDYFSPSDLLPMQCTWSYKENGKIITHNFYDIPFIRKMFEVRSNKNNKLTKLQQRKIDALVLKILDLLSKGEFVPVIEGELADNTLTITDQDLIKLGFKSIGYRAKKQKEKVRIKDAELIISNLYATRFGMSYNESLAKVLAQGPSYFALDSSYNYKVDHKDFLIALTSKTGNTYIALKDSFIASKLENKRIDSSFYLKREINGIEKLCRIDEEGNILYIAGDYVDGKPHKTVTEKLVKGTNLVVYIVESVDDAKLFIDKDNYEQIIYNDRDFLKSRLFAEMIANTDSDCNKLAAIFSAFCEILTKKIPKTTGNIIKDYDNPEKHPEIIKNLIDNITQLCIDHNITVTDNLKRTIEGSVLLFMKAYVNGVTHEAKHGKIERGIRFLNYGVSLIWRNLLKEFDRPRIEKLANLKFASFLKSLLYVVARIPAQTLQSFMRMRVVAFTTGLTNAAYVSHYQTWLLGSDYDIDKGYMSSYEFTKNGKLIMHSPLALSNSINDIELSAHIPVPDQDKVWTLDTKGLDVSLYIKGIQITKNGKLINTHNTLRNLILIMRASKDGHITADDTKKLNIIIIELNKHEQYFKNKSAQLLNKILSNISVLGICDVIGDIRNFRQAYTPIGMAEFLDIALNSSMGLDSMYSNTLLVTDRNNLTVENMVGRSVIGIAAVGEKIFFNISHIFNKLVRSGDINKFKLLLYKFNIKLPQSNGTYVDCLSNLPPNIFFENKEVFEDIFKFIEERMLANDGNLSETAKASITSYILKQLNLQPDAAIVISQLLSAATDNAKELILGKINAGSTTAGIYLHLILNNVEIDKIADFMTSPIMETIMTLVEKQVNIFNNLGSKAINVLANTIKALNGDINLYRFLDYSEINYLQKIAPFNIDDAKLDKQIKRFVLNNELIIVKNKSSLPENISKFIDYINELITIRVNLYPELEPKLRAEKLNNDLDIILDIQLLAEETKFLGRILGSNLGLATNSTEISLFLNNISDYIKKNKYRVDRFFKKNKETGELEFDLSKNDTLLTQSEIESIIKEAKEFDIIDNFDIHKFLFDSQGAYRNAAINYFTLIKYNHNILGYISESPMTLNTLKAFGVTHLACKSNIRRHDAVDRILKVMAENKIYIDASLRSIIETYFIKTLTRHFLMKLNFNITVNGTYFDKKGNRRIGTKTLDFKNLEDIATFKLWVETTFFNKLLDTFKDNKFVDELKVEHSLRDRTTFDKVHRLRFSTLNMRSEFNDYELLQFDNAVHDLAQLRDKSIDGIDVLTVLAAYNLIVNLNQANDYALTRLLSALQEVQQVQIPFLASWSDFLSDVDYSNTVPLTFIDKTYVKNMLYYLTRNGYNSGFSGKWNKDYNRRDIKYIEKNVNGLYETIEFSKDLQVARDMSDYFIIDNPLDRFRNPDLSVANIEELTSELSLDLIKELISNNTIQIAYYCE